MNDDLPVQPTHLPERIQRQADGIAELARIMAAWGGSGMNLLERNPILGGARIRMAISRDGAEACAVHCRRMGWEYHIMKMGGQMTVNLPLTPAEYQRALAAPPQQQKELEQ